MLAVMSSQNRQAAIRNKHFTVSERAERAVARPGAALVKGFQYGIPLVALLVGTYSMLAPDGVRSAAAAVPETAAGTEAEASKVVFASQKSEGVTGTAKAAVGGPDNCAVCHQFQGAPSHPVNVAPSMAVPGALPLSGGRIACTTCHDPQAADGHTTRGVKGRTFLRNDDGVTNLCTQCHTAGDAKTNPHGNSRVKAHASSSPRALSLSTTSRAVSLDSESKDCLMCHDGTLASDAGTHSSRAMNFTSNSEHPIGIQYPSRNNSASGDGQLKPIRSLDRRVRLFDQTIGCGSCHSVYSREKSLLVMSNQNSRLCLSCHIE